MWDFCFYCCHLIGSRKTRIRKHSSVRLIETAERTKAKYYTLKCVPVLKHLSVSRLGLLRTRVIEMSFIWTPDTPLTWSPPDGPTVQHYSTVVFPARPISVQRLRNTAAASLRLLKRIWMVAVGGRHAQSGRSWFLCTPLFRSSSLSVVAYAGENRSRALETRRTAGKQGSLFVLFRAVLVKGLFGAFITKRERDHGLCYYGSLVCISCSVTVIKQFVLMLHHKHLC